MLKFRQNMMPFKKIEWLGLDLDQFIQFECDINSKTSIFLDISSDYFSKESPKHANTFVFLQPISFTQPHFTFRLWNSIEQQNYGTISIGWNDNWVNNFKEYLYGFNVIGIDWINFITSQGKSVERGCLSINGSTSIMTPFPKTWNRGKTILQFGNMPLKIKSIEVQQDKQTVMKLVSVRKGSVGLLYDEINQNYYKNLGNGDFELGPDIRK